MKDYKRLTKRVESNFGGGLLGYDLNEDKSKYQLIYKIGELEDKIENGTLVKKTQNDNVFQKLFEMLKEKMYVCPNFFEMRACSEKAWKECLHRSWSKYFNGRECVTEDYSKMFDLWFQAEQKLKELKGEQR